MIPSFVAFDLDGTLFRHTGLTKVSRRVCEALAAAHRAGSRIVCASGRPWMMLGKELLDAPWLDWRVGLNGSDVTDAENRHRLLRPLSKAAALECIGTVRHPECHWDIAVPDAFYFEYRMDHRWMKGPLRNLKTVKWDFRGPLRNCWHVPSAMPYAVAADTILKIEVQTPEGPIRERSLADLRAIAERHGGLEIAPMNYGIEVTSPGVDKAQTLLLLLEELGIEAASGVAFGDAANDLPMCGKPWTFVAMGNAEPQILELADDVTDGVAEDGVATWLERHLGA